MKSKTLTEWHVNLTAWFLYFTFEIFNLNPIFKLNLN